jgi:hypothetical protein
VRATSKLLAAASVATVALAAACGSGTEHRPAAKADRPVLELTGRVGDIGLGEPMSKVESEYGAPDTAFHVTFRHAGTISGYYRLHHGRVLVGFDGGRVGELDVRTPYYRTEDGLGVGGRIPLGRCHATASNGCEHHWHGFVWDAWAREKPCNCWVKVGREADSLPATTKNFRKPWFFIDVRHGRVSRFFFASQFVD